MTVLRVRYRERQILRQRDLSDEKRYQMGMRRRHNIAHHGWGIVTGLGLVADDDLLQIEPGLAVDGYGRQLVLPQAVEIGLDVLDCEALGGALYPRHIDVWLLYARQPEIHGQNGRYPCGPGQHNRWREEARVRLEVASDEPVPPRRPAAVAVSDRDFGPHRSPPDDPAREWPIYLGRIRCTEQGVEVDQEAARPYATLYGATVTAPSGRARLQVENERAGARRVFAVSTAEADGTYQDRLTIGRSGDTVVYGHTRIHGDLVLPQSAGLVFTPLPAPPEAAAPWQIYHTAVSPDEKRTSHQLRFEIGHPGDEGDPRRYKLAVGYCEAADTFSPCFSVRADGSVIINGDLDLDGELIEGPIQADPSDPRFAGALLDSWLGGIASAANKVDAFYSNALEITFETQLPDNIAADSTLSYTVLVKNTGDDLLENIRVVEIISVTGGSQERSVIGTDSSLNAGASRTFNRDYDVPDAPGETITLLVTAMATRQDGRLLQSTVSRTIPIILELG
jgi:hypothetical protein